MKIIIVTKRTAYSRLTEDPTTQSLLGKKDIDQLKKAHERHQVCLNEVIKHLKNIGVRPHIISSGQAFDDKISDFVITVGGDGTLLSASHNVGSTPLMGINSDPETSVGYLCHATPKTLEISIKRHINDNPKTFSVTRMEVLVGGKSIAKRVLNEALFTHSCPAAMTKVLLDNELYSCSGIWVGTGAGSTGAIKSAGGKRLPMCADMLQAIVRESYNKGKTKHVQTQFKLVSKISDAVLYLDGPFLQIPVGYGDTVTCRASKEPLNLIQ